MIALMSLFIPPFFLVLVREKILRRPKDLKRRAVTYVFSVLGLNWTMMLLLYYVFHSSGDLFAKLNGYFNYACKYILLAMLLAGVEPFAEYCIREKLEVHLPTLKKPTNWKHFRLYAGLYATVLFFLNFIRIFDNNFWFDEAFTLLQMNSSFGELTEWAASDVHPPLYYYMLKIVHMILGSQGWAYHALSLIPCLIILILALTLFWNKFGGRVSVILITFIGLSYNAVYYNMEVRMYSWANLAVLLSFYELWKILEEHRKRDYLFFALFSLAAAYIHYFAMVTVAFFYIVLMVAAIFKKLNIKMVLATWMGTIIGYLPWAVCFLKTVWGIAVAGGFWIHTTPSFTMAVQYLFSSRFKGWAIWCILIVAAAFFSLYETNILTVAIKEKKLCIFLSFRQIRISNFAIWGASGILCSLGTILFAIIFSKIIFPVFSIRYIYAASVAAWMVLAVVISRLKLGRLWTVVLWLFLIVGFIPQYQEIYTREKAMTDDLRETLRLTADICENDILLAYNNQRIYTALEYYYPSYNRQTIELYDVPELDTTICYYLFVSPPETAMEPIFEELDRQGFGYTLVVDYGNLGTMATSVYRVEGQKEPMEIRKDDADEE